MFSLQYVGLSIAVGGWRAGRLDRLLTGERPRPRLLLKGSAIGALAGLGAAIVAVALTGSVIVPMLLASPVLLVVDSVRYSVLRSRPGSALAIDAFWTAATVMAAAAVGSANLIVLLWLLSGLTPAVLVVWLRRNHAAASPPSLDAHLVGSPDDTTTRWWTADQVVAAISGLAAGALIAGILGPESYGIFRLAQLVYSPMGVLFLALPSLLLPRWSRIGYDRTRVARESSVLTSLLVAAVVATMLVLAGGLLDQVLGRVFGEAWLSLTPGVLVAVGLGSAGSAMAAVGVVGWRLTNKGVDLFARRSLPAAVALVVTASILYVSKTLLHAVIAMSIGQIVVGLLTVQPILEVGRAR